MKDIEEFSDNHLYEKMLQEDEIPVSINHHDSVSLRSIAISLKRIADALYYDEEGIGIATILTDLADK